jgi:serine/threonine-protein kinase
MTLDPTHPRVTPAGEELEGTAPRLESWVGRVIDGRYRLEARLATGGMGEVYKATHVELGRTLALKVMRPELSGDASFVERFRREAMTASRLGHPHIVDIIDSGRSESGQFYFVMEFLEGEPLSALLARGPVPLPVALEVVAQVAEALDVAHRAGVVHRDLKPDNVIVLQRGGKPFVKLVDFGIAKSVLPAADQKQTTHGVILGTPQYMAPEQAAGVAVDARADVYALGLIVFELLTGKPPLTGETAALVMAAHINQKAPALPAEFPQGLRTLVAAMLAKRPGERPASMAAVREALAAVPRTGAASRAGLVKGVAAVVAAGVAGALAVLALRPATEAPRVDARTMGTAGARDRETGTVGVAPRSPESGEPGGASDRAAPGTGASAATDSAAPGTGTSAGATDRAAPGTGAAAAVDVPADGVAVVDAGSTAPHGAATQGSGESATEASTTRKGPVAPKPGAGSRGKVRPKSPATAPTGIIKEYPGE